VIAAIMIRWIFNDQFGIVNVVLEAIGLEGQPWLVQRWSAFGIIVLTDIWLWTPWFTLLLLAGLQSLPRSRSRPRPSTAPPPGACSAISRCRCCVR
jgi:multiple sugar transport system permease protein